MRRFSVPSKGIGDLAILMIAMNALLYWLNKTIDQRPDLSGLDFLLWLGIPFIFTITYLTLGRLWSTAGLAPKFQGLGIWFLFAFLLPAALASSLLLTNLLLGSVTLPSDLGAKSAMVGLVGVSGLFIKNIFEEFIFRGFLTGRFSQTVGAGLQGHILTGAIWSFWHLVYWTAMLPQDQIAEISSLPLSVFVLVGFVALTSQSILLGELRLVTGSIWAGVVLHTMNNAIFAWFVAAKAVPLGGLTAAWLTPVDIGLVYSGLMGLIGLRLWRWRLRAY